MLLLYLKPVKGVRGGVKNIKIQMTLYTYWIKNVKIHFTLYTELKMSKYFDIICILS